MFRHDLHQAPGVVALRVDEAQAGAGLDQLAGVVGEQRGLPVAGDAEHRPVAEQVVFVDRRVATVSCPFPDEQSCFGVFTRDFFKDFSGAPSGVDLATVVSGVQFVWVDLVGDPDGLDLLAVYRVSVLLGVGVGELWEL